MLHLRPTLYLVLCFLVGLASGGALAQPAPDSAADAATVLEAAPPAVDTAGTTQQVAPETDTESLPPSSALPAVAEPPPPLQPAQAVSPPTGSDAAAQDPPAADTASGAPPPGATQAADSLIAEVGALRTAVATLLAQNDSLARALRNGGRVDTVVVRDTTARRAAQDAIDDVANTATNALQNFVPKLIVSILLLAVALWVVRGFVWLLEALAARTAERRLFYKRLIPIVRLFIWAFAVYLIIAAIFKVPPNSLLAAATAVGVAVGFAAQEVLKNIFGGIVIILDQPFQVGDKVGIGNTYGEVVSIGLRSTRIVTPDDNLVSVPNSQVVADQVSNANAGELNLQVVTDLFLPGWIDVGAAKRIAYAAAANSKYVYLDKPIVVVVKDEFRETFLLHLKVKAYVLDTRYEFLLMSDVTEAAKTEFVRQGLLSPMPIGVDVDVDIDIDDDDEDDAPRGDGRGGSTPTAPSDAPSRSDAPGL